MLLTARERWILFTMYRQLRRHPDLAISAFRVYEV